MPIFASTASSISKIRTSVTNVLKAAFNRQNSAYLLMIVFVICTSVGAFRIYPPAGWITLGVTSGFVGYLLGSE